LARLHADNLEDGRKELRVGILLLLLLLEGEVEAAQQQVLLVTLPLGRAVAATTSDDVPYQICVIYMQKIKPRQQ
jgi:hypothetical protein